jgi:hypothetical protein
MQTVIIAAAVISAMTAVVAVVLGHCQWHRSGPVIKIKTATTVIPGEARCDVPGQLTEGLGVGIVQADNRGRGACTVEGWGFETRTGGNFGPPLRPRQELEAWYDNFSLRIEGHDNRVWVVDEPWLDSMCDRERVRREHVRPWIMVDGKKRRPRRWGLPDCYGENPRWRDTNRLAWRRWRRRTSRPVSVVLRPHSIPVYDTIGPNPARIQWP